MIKARNIGVAMIIPLFLIKNHFIYTSFVTGIILLNVLYKSFLDYNLMLHFEIPFSNQCISRTHQKHRASKKLIPSIVFPRKS